MLIDMECRVLVTGGRDFNDRQAVFDALDKLATVHRYYACHPWSGLVAAAVAYRKAGYVYGS